MNRSAKPASVTLPGHATAVRQCLDRGHCLLGGLFVEVVDHDGGAVGGELDRDLGADTAAGAGDDGDLAVQFAHVC